MEQSAQRPGSIRSVASNSSIGSGVSLSRRPRINRARSRTLTGSSSRSEDPPQSPTESILPYLNDLVVQDPLEEKPTIVETAITVPPINSPSSSEQVLEIRSTDTASSLEPTAADATIVEAPQLLNAGKQSKAIRVASSLPHLDTGYRPPPSAFSRDPALTPVANVRDSVSTHQSGSSSSLYPPSTSTTSMPGSPTSPLSMSDRIDQLILPSVAPEVNDVQEYDSDDVSYRLRLLVKNNYFLPPAHSKPSPEDFASTSPNARKASTPFLDLFRVGKSKSKPSTPPGPSPGFDSAAPMLRTTSDSIAAPYALRPQQPRSSSQMPRLSPHLTCASPRGRVVVVREKMNDIAIAAKQAEQDLKTRGVRIDQGSQKAKQEPIDDVIDPTDAVDIPLLSPSYPFAIQASALHGLGVLDSVGAAALADRLPPTKNPNLSTSFDSAEDSWRKALLHEAVHHSLDNTPDVSSFSHILGASTPLGSPRSKRTDIPLRVDTPTNTAKMIQQRIVAQPLIDTQEPRPTKHVRKKSNQSQASTSKGKNGTFLMVSPTSTQASGRPASYFPERVDTPSGPMTPLGPPPRRHFVNTVHSLSQTDLISGHQSLEISDRSMSRGSPYNALRRTMSSPLLAEGYESSSARQPMPHMPTATQHPRDSQATTVSFNTIRESYDHLNGVMSDSHESEDGAGVRASLALSAVRGRPSLSEYSLSSMSPTTSVFQDMLNRDDFSGSSLNAGPSRFSLEQQNAIRAGITPRYSAISPPPRMSSSLSYAVLAPPRGSSLNYFAPGKPHVPPPVPQSDQPHQSDSDKSTLQLEILAPEPTTPPFPLSRHAPLAVTISTTSTPVTIHSAPGPSSPTSFFDTIQSQPNAMDDLESSSDEDEDEAEHQRHQDQKLFVDSRHRAVSNVSPSQRPSIMRLGNFSTPYLRTGESFRQNLLPIGNNPHSKQSSTFRQPFFMDRKKDVLPSSTFDFFKYAKEHPPPTLASLSTPAGSSDPPRPSTADDVTVWKTNQRAQASLRKLDGMLIQHMEDEKDTIKRIATTLKQTSPSKRIR
ncbi:hypothetical protein BYT27DRAFT_7338957 [Phlegmacium glaucopus]|nr:hypothetical protein BYT27DRAFT_7338957 [Phlegmacium glaucopus]